MAYTNKIDDEKVKNVIQQLFDEDFPYPMEVEEVTLEQKAQGRYTLDFDFKIHARYIETSAIWKLGDRLKRDNGNTAMIIKDNNGYYSLMITTIGNPNAFNTNQTFGSFSNLGGLKDIYGKHWHKVGNKNERN